MIRLFIENTEVELDKSVQFAITKQFEDLSNPTTIINTWSKTVSIPFTQRNNDLFGKIYNPDRLIVSGGSNFTGIYFDPTRKLDMRLQYGDTIILTGYAKLNEVKQVNNKGTYEITLFGQLGKLFQDMKKITFDSSTTETDYLIDGSTWVDEKINRTLVYNSWNSSGQTHEALYPKKLEVQGGGTVNHPAYNITDIIGFAPNNAFSDNFKYDTYQVNSNTSDTFENFLGDSFTEDTGIDPQTIMKNGLLPREYGEYRSYNQLPFIYWNKLFQIFQNKAESVTGYTFDLDSTWFSTSNPYWYNLVYMLKPFETKDSKDGAVNYYDMGLTDTNTNWLGGAWSTEKSGEMYAISTSVQTYTLVNGFGWGNTARFNFGKNTPLFCSFNLGLELRADKSGSGTNDKDCYFATGNAFVVTVEVLNPSGTVVKSSNVIVHRSEYTGSTSGYDVNIVYDEKAIKGSSSDTDNYFRINPQLKFYLSKDDFGSYFYFRTKVKWVNNTTPFVYEGGQSFSYGLDVTTYNSCTLQTQLAKGIKSNSKFILNDLWNNDYNLFDEVIRYCKMFRILISVDELNKKIVFKPFTKYFENYTVEDWTNKVDKSKDYTITPITLENKYVLFDYKDSDTKLGKEYKEKYGVNYGEYRLITDYNFNSETKKLFENVPQSIVNTDTVLSLSNCYLYHKVDYSFPAEIYVYNKDKDNKQKDIFGSFYFHRGLKNFDIETRLHLLGVYITDDTDFQLANNTFFYDREMRNKIAPASYPFLDIVSGSNMCVFNIPKENYTYNNNYSGKNTIYTNYWENYINERYNIQNKKITCYVLLKPSEYQNFDWNKLVKIGNQLCIVNKIYDYDISANTPTKVDLITIQDINNYIS